MGKGEAVESQCLNGTSDVAIGRVALTDFGNYVWHLCTEENHLRNSLAAVPNLKLSASLRGLKLIKHGIETMKRFKVNAFFIHISLYSFYLFLNLVWQADKVVIFLHFYKRNFLTFPLND